MVFLLLVAVLLVDAATRQLLTGRTRIDFVSSATAKSSTLFVYYPGILADGVMSSREVIGEWQQYGDVLLVGYDGRRFEPKRIVSDVARDIERRVDSEGYSRVVFIGSSMGGLLSYDTYQMLEKHVRANFSIVALDAPTKRSDLQSPLDTMALGSRAWWAGAISNVFSKLYFNATFVKPKEENIEDGVDRERLAETVESAKSHQLSWAMDQNRYIIDHGGLKPGSLKGVNVLYVRSARDTDTVRPQAFNSWNVAAGNKAGRVEVDSTHVGYNERPETWRRAFRLDILPAL